MTTSARPLLVAVMSVPATMSADAWRLARGQIAGYASELGYGLLDVLELHGAPAENEATYVALEGHISRSEPPAVLCWGVLDDPRLQTIADQCGATILTGGPGIADGVRLTVVGEGATPPAGGDLMEGGRS